MLSLTALPLSRVGYSHCMRLTRQLVVLIVGLGWLLSACGSGGAPADQDGQTAATATPRSERTEREATIMQQQEQPPAETGAESEPQQAGPAEETIEVEASGDDAPSEQAAVAGVIGYGHRQGLPFSRNVVGDPEAPVLIVEYSDFQ